MDYRATTARAQGGPSSEVSQAGAGMEGMAICEWCRREMMDHVTCTEERYLFSDGSFERFKIGVGPGERSIRFDTCGDCGAPRGGFHHPGCDMEACPRCRHQAIMCDCPAL